MTEPEEPTVTEETVVTESVATEEPTTTEEISDAELRAWAKENGIEGVPASGKLSATWREQITVAMAAALDPKEEASVDAISTESSTSTETSSTDQESTDSTDEETPVEAAAKPVFEYRDYFQAPNTFVTSQTYTS